MRMHPKSQTGPVPFAAGSTVPQQPGGSWKIDVDVLAFYEAEGAGYQTRINRALRASMLRTLRRRKAG